MSFPTERITLVTKAKLTNIRVRKNEEVVREAIPTKAEKNIHTEKEAVMNINKADLNTWIISGDQEPSVQTKIKVMKIVA